MLNNDNGESKGGFMNFNMKNFLSKSYRKMEEMQNKNLLDKDKTFENLMKKKNKFFKENNLLQSTASRDSLIFSPSESNELSHPKNLNQNKFSTQSR